MYAWGMRHVGAVVVVVVLGLVGGGGGVARAMSMGGSSGASCRQVMMQKPMGVMRHMEMPGPSSCVAFRPALSSLGFTASASSAVVGRGASGAVGRGAGSFWESARLGGRVRLPQTVTIVLHGVRRVSGVRYVPRRGVGEIGGFVVSLSRDGRHFGSAVARGLWQDNATVKQVEWMPRAVRAVRVRDPVGFAGGGWACGRFAVCADGCAWWDGWWCCGER